MIGEDVDQNEQDEVIPPTDDQVSEEAQDSDEASEESTDEAMQG